MQNACKICLVKENSIAHEMGIEIDDEIIAINNEKINDIIDYKYLISDEYIEVELKKKDGEEWILEIEKEYDEDLGIEFKNPIIDKAKFCSNKCIFCFIDQLPKGMRKSLYFKDDDSRLSFLQGNFVTLTNMSDKDIERIIRYRISPLNISVHTTNSEIRAMMLGNSKAANIMNTLKRLADSNIEMNCQIVLCRGINDGEILTKTLEDLYSLYPAIKNVAVVPVGATKYRDKLFKVDLYNKNTAIEVIKIVADFQNKLISSNKIFARPSDEFFILADREVPGLSYYDDFEQLEDGIGMITYLNKNIEESLNLIEFLDMDLKISFITGKSAYKCMQEICKKIENKIKGLKINLYCIKNEFFGESITVTGLLTGVDIKTQLKNKELGSVLFIPSNVLKSGEDIFLDDIDLNELEKELGVNILVCKYDGSDLIEKIIITGGKV